MLNDIFQFLKREKFYTGLFIALVLIYGSSIFLQKKETSQKSEKVEQFKQAEKRLEQKVKASGSLQEYLKDRPQTQAALQFFSLLILLGLVGGTVLDFLLITRPWLRARFTFNTGPPPAFWKFSMLFKVIVWFFAVNLVLALILGFLKKLLDWNNEFLMLLHTVIAHFIAFGLIYWTLKREGGVLRDAGFRKPDNLFKEIGYGWAGYLGIVPFFALILIVVVAITKFFNYDPQAHPLVNVFLDDQPGASKLIIFSLFLAIVMGPIFEEIFFRGFCYPIFRQRFGRLPAMVITSSIFAFIHDNTFAFWPIFVLGMGLCYVYDKRASLIPSITLHITHNALFISYFFFAKDLLARELG